MQHWIAVFGSMLLTLGCAAPALARSATLVGGGLTALPTAILGPDRLDNGGFETLVAGVPAAWTTGPGLALDERVAHAGGVSYRATGDFASATQTVRLTRGVYRLSGWIRTQNVGLAPGAGVRLQFDRRPFVNDWTTSGLVAGTTDWTLYELPNLVVTADTTVTIRLENHRNGTGTAWFDDVRLQEQEPSAVEAFLLYPNFRGMLFDDQPSVMRFDVMVRPPGGDLGRFRVRGTLADEATGRVLARPDYPATARFVATLDGSAMPTHRPHLVTFALVDASDGVAVAEYPAYRVSRVPASARAGMNVAVDARNRVLVRGVPRFVLGVYDTGPGHGTEDSFWENHLWSRLGERRLDALRINFYLDYRHGEAPAGAVKALMSSLQKRGVMYLQAGHCFATRAAGPGFGIQRSDGYVRDIGAHPGSGGYYAADACPSTLIPEVFAQYDRLRRLDPDSITLVTHPSAPDLALWRDGADVLSSAPAPLVGAPPAGGYRHREVADATALARRAVEDARPVMTALPFSSGTSLGRFPTRREMRNHAWMAVVEGARGLWWWTLGDNGLSAVCPGWCAEKSRRLEDLAAVVAELADLEPALLGDEAPGALTGNSHPAAIRTRVTVVDGTGYVFAYNATEAPVRATLSWNAPGGTVIVHAEGRTLATAGRSFTDSFAPYAAHVYVIGRDGVGSASLGAAVGH